MKVISTVYTNSKGNCLSKWGIINFKRTTTKYFNPTGKCSRRNWVGECQVEITKVYIDNLPIWSYFVLRWVRNLAHDSADADICKPRGNGVDIRAFRNSTYLRANLSKRSTGNSQTERIILWLYVRIAAKIPWETILFRIFHSKINFRHGNQYMFVLKNSARRFTKSTSRSNLVSSSHPCREIDWHVFGLCTINCIRINK